MGFMALAKALCAGKPLLTYTPAATITIENNINLFLVDLATSGVSCSKILTPSIIVNRRITILGTGSGSMTLTNNSNTTTAGQMDLAGSDRTITNDVALSLRQLSTGAWRLDTHPL